MTTKKKPKVSRAIVAKARKVLKFAQEQAKQVSNRYELANALYTPDGMVLRLFPTREERSAYFKTKEYKQIVDLIISLPRPPLSDEVYEIRIPPLENGRKKAPAKRRA